MQFGKRLWICPSWREVPDENAVNVMLDPVWHSVPAPTRPPHCACSGWMVWIWKENRDRLRLWIRDPAIAALKLGAAKAIGIDIDPQAIQASRDNAERNGVFDRCELYLPDAQPEVMKADVVVANITAEPITRAHR